MSQPATLRLLTRADLCAKLRCRSSKCYALTSRPDFPAPTYELGHPLWIEAEVDAWLLDRISQERAQRAPRQQSSAPPAPERRAPRAPRDRSGAGRRSP